MPSGQLVIEQEYFFDTTPEIVFKALTEPKELAKWFLSKAKIDARRGGDYEFTWQGGYKHSGKVMKFVKNKTLVLSWPDKFESGKVFTTQAAFTLSRKGNGTLLKLKHTGFKKGDEWIWLYGAIQSGWAYFLTNLKSVLAQGVDLRSRYDDV